MTPYLYKVYYPDPRGNVRWIWYTAILLPLVLLFAAISGCDDRTYKEKIDALETCEDGSTYEGVYLDLSYTFQGYARMMTLCSRLSSPFEVKGCMVMSGDFSAPLASCDMQQRRHSNLEKLVGVFRPQVEAACEAEPYCAGFMYTLPAL